MILLASIHIGADEARLVEKLKLPFDHVSAIGTRLSEGGMLGDGPTFVKLGRRSVGYILDDLNIWLNDAVAARPPIIGLCLSVPIRHTSWNWWMS
jgi:hypothetical protein